MSTIFHAVIGYVFLLLTVRILTRRPGGQMTLFEFVIVFLIGGIIILATVGDDRSMTNCVCAVIAVGSMHRFVSWVKFRFPRIGTAIDGTPIVLLKQGRWQTESMRGMKLDDMDVMAAARTKGLRNLNEIKYAILERNGQISIIKNKQ